MSKTVKEIDLITERYNALQRQLYKPLRMDIGFCKPLALWYEMMTEEQRRNLPIRVLNALDSIHTIFKGRL